jgi:hypothetical protein
MFFILSEFSVKFSGSLYMAQREISEVLGLTAKVQCDVAFP